MPSWLTDIHNLANSSRVYLRKNATVCVHENNSENNNEAQHGSKGHIMAHHVQSSFHQHGIGMLYSDISLFTYVQIVVYFLNAAFQFYTSKVI